MEAPHECDADMQRDGVSPRPPAGRGERSWWLGQLVESAPLHAWQHRFGGRTPQEIVALPVGDDWKDELHAAWCRAAVRQRDAAWSRALLGAPSTPPATGPGTSSLAEREKLLATLEDGERAEWVAAFIAAHGLSEAFQLLGVCTVPWAEPLGRAVVDALDIARDAGSYPWSFSGVMGLAERCLDPGEADRLEILTATPDEQEDASPGAGGYWSEAFQRLVGTLRLRASMLAELSDAPTPVATGRTFRPVRRLRSHLRLGRLTTWVLTQSTIDCVVAPGVKISATPFSFSGAMSASGMMPPPKTLMSSASRCLSSSMTFTKSVLCAPERIDRPIASASS